MTTIQTILLLALLAIWLCFSVVFLITAVQSFIASVKSVSGNRRPVTQSITKTA